MNGKDEPLVKLVNDWQESTSNTLGNTPNGLDSEKGTTERELLPSQRVLKDPKTGRFLPGTGGHGRRPGTVCAVSKARAILADHSEELIGLALEQVRSGKSASLLAELLRFSMPQARSQLANVSIPAAEEAMRMGDFDGALAAITSSVLSGETSPDAAKVIVDQVKSAEESKRYRALSEEVEKLSRVVEGQARRIS